MILLYHIIIWCKDENFKIFSFFIFFSIFGKFSLYKSKKKKTINTTKKPKGTSSNITFICYDQCVAQYISKILTRNIIQSLNKNMQNPHKPQFKGCLHSIIRPWKLECSLGKPLFLGLNTFINMDNNWF